MSFLVPHEIDDIPHSFGIGFLEIRYLDTKLLFECSDDFVICHRIMAPEQVLILRKVIVCSQFRVVGAQLVLREYEGYWRPPQMK
jgi:hypothetical protein